MPASDRLPDLRSDAARSTRRFTAEAAVDHDLLTRIAAASLATYISEPERDITDSSLRTLRQGFIDGRNMCRAGAAETTTPEPNDHSDHSDHDDDVTAADLEAALAEFVPELVVIASSPDTITTLDNLVTALYAVSTELARRVQEQARPLTTAEWRSLDTYFIRGLLLIAAHEAPRPTPSHASIEDCATHHRSNHPDDPPSSSC
jgi:hypothetical protein